MVIQSGFWIDQHPSGRSGNCFPLPLGPRVSAGLMSGLSVWLWAVPPGPFRDMGSIYTKGRKPTDQVKR